MGGMPAYVPCCLHFDEFMSQNNRSGVSSHLSWGYEKVLRDCPEKNRPATTDSRRRKIQRRHSDKP
jgi:hypothetical protein